MAASVRAGVDVGGFKGAGWTGKKFNNRLAFQN
jgi:hypothetical protein